jgi:hypothetical protein
LLLSGAQATRFHRMSERKVLGANIGAPDATEAEADTTRGFERLPLVAAGATWMPYKEVLAIAKRLLLL